MILINYLSNLDWSIILGFLALIIGIGVSFHKQSSNNLVNFFLGGRNLPWYIAGVSMVATTFAADTPLAVTEMVNKNGISGNWLWWNMLAGGLLTTFFFSNLWRRSEVLTEVELIELRYAGKGAAFLRGFKAIYLGVFLNCIIIGWVNLALMTLIDGFFNLGTFSFLGFELKYSLLLTFGFLILVALYASFAGLLGVAITDFIQFCVAMLGTILLAVYVVNSNEIGGLANLKASIPESSLRFFPEIGKGSGSTLAIGFGSFLAMAGMQWWASWYPGAEPGGGGYVAQRMLSAKSEKDAVYATLFFQLAHYSLRPWPWIIVALCAMVIYPDLQGDEVKFGYIYAIRDFLPAGIKGLLVVAFVAAYMSTISTQLNWGASYVVNDFYKRFINTEGSEKIYVNASRIATFLLMIIGLLFTTQMSTISGVWSFLIECGAGLGLVLILRWYWWRINKWSEITATVVPFAAYAIAKFLLVKIDPDFGLGLTESPKTFIFTIATTTIAWLAVTFATEAEPKSHLQKFYNKVKPQGNWKPFANENVHIKQNMTFTFLAWLSALLMIYSVLFLFGKFLFAEYTSASYWTISAVISFFILRFAIRKANLFNN